MTVELNFYHIFLYSAYSDSVVFTPRDGDQWLLAKQTVQVADFVYAGSVEHLLKTHLLIEPICVAVRRHFHKLHPIRQILQFHCRGVLGTNKFFINTLTGVNGTSDKLFGVGYGGGYAIMRKAFNELTWDDIDFPANIKVSELITDPVHTSCHLRAKYSVQ